MSDLLSQEELDALLRSGISSYSDEEDEPVDEGPSSFVSFQEQARPKGNDKRRLKMKRSSKVNPQEVIVQKAEFEDFEDLQAPEETTNLEIILNLDLEIRVELGKSVSTVKEVLEMGSGSVLELDKLNGEPVDLFVNEKPFAKGEMIVIGENFGVRVTDILTVPEIIEALR